MTAAWVERFLAAVAEERRRRLLDEYRRESLLIQEGRRRQAERIRAFGMREFYEPNGGED